MATKDLEKEALERITNVLYEIGTQESGYKKIQKIMADYYDQKGHSKEHLLLGLLYEVASDLDFLVYQKEHDDIEICKSELEEISDKICDEIKYINNIK